MFIDGGLGKLKSKRVKWKDNVVCLVINMAKYLKMNNSNWRKLCKNQIKAEQQQMKLEDRKQIKFNFEKEKK